MNPAWRIYAAMAAIALASTVVLLPLYGFFLFVVDDTNAEYRKASVAYGPQVPASVEGGDPLFLVLAALPWLVVLVIGAVAIHRMGFRGGVGARTAGTFAWGTAVLQAGGFTLSYLSTGPFWPPAVG